MDEAMKKELMRLCEPVAAFMQKNCTPHDAVIVTDVQVRMVSDEFSVPVSECGRRGAASGTDGRSGLWTEQRGSEFVRIPPCTLDDDESREETTWKH